MGEVPSAQERQEAEGTDGPEPWASDMQMPHGPPTVFGPRPAEPPVQPPEPPPRTSKRRVQKNTTARQPEPRSPERRRSPSPSEENGLLIRSLLRKEEWIRRLRQWTGIVTKRRL